MVKRKLAQISGATLGYITNDVRGAVAGYKAAGKVYDYVYGSKNLPKKNNMPPVGRRASTVSTTSSDSWPRGSRRKRVVSTPSSGGGGARRVLFKRRKIVAGGGSAVTVSASKVKGHVAKKGKKRKVKVSKTLRKKIKQVLSQKGPIGIVKEAMYSPIMYCSDNIQNIFQGSPILCEGLKNWAFTPTHFIQHASVLWNKEQWGALAGDNRQIANVLGYTPNYRLEVRNSYYVMKLKNNSTRVVTVKLWDIQPKGTVNDTDCSDMNAWFGTELTRMTYSAFNGAENPQNINQYYIGFNPNMMSSFKRHFHLQETVINMEPGKEYYHKVQGPNNKLLNFNNFFRNGSYRPIQSFCKQTLVVVTTDLASDSLGNTVGRYTEMSSVKPYGVLVETEYFSKLKCPDQVGWISSGSLPAANTVVNDKAKGYAFVIHRYGLDQSGTVVHMDDNNPIDITDDQAS